MLFNDACRNIGITNYAQRYEILKASITVSTQDTVLFLLCAIDYCKKPSPAKMKGIIKIFITPSKTSSFMQDADLFTINLTQECAKSTIAESEKIKIYNRTTAENLFNFITDSGNGLKHDNVLGDAIKKTNNARAGKATSSITQKNVKKELSRMRKALKPYWGDDLVHLGLPKLDHFYAK